MSTANKLTYLNVTKQELKQKINNLGGSIDDNTTFRQYANQLQNVYDNLPKTEYQEGTEVNLGVTSKGKLDYDNGVVGIGQSSQETTQGYNIMNFNVTQDSRVTYNGDGTITINGRGGFGIPIESIKLLANETYREGLQVVSGSITGGDINSALMSFNSAGGIWLTTAGLIIYTPTENITKAGVWTNENITFNNLRVKIWGYKGTDVKPFEPYTNGASPNPSYPQTINSVTGNQDVVVSGKNELEGIELGDIDPQGGVPFSSESSFRSINYIPYDTSKTYYVSVNSVQPTNQGLNLRFYNASKQYIGYSTLTGSGSNFVITKGNQVTTTDLVPKYFRFRQTATAGPINSINDNVMIATISGATYEPYVTPKPYQFSLGDYKFYGIGNFKDTIRRSSGKNLINSSKYINAVVNNTSIGNTGTLEAWATSWTTWIEMKPNQTYVFSGNLSNVNSNVVRVFVTNSEVAIGTSVTRVDNLQNGGTYTNTSGYKYLVLEFLDVTTYGGNWQIEEGSTASDYEPYGVGVWFKYGVIGEALLDGSSDENWTYNAVSQGSLFRNSTSITDEIRDGTYAPYSNYYIGIPSNLGSTRANGQFYINYASNYLDIIDNSYTSISDYKTWLSTHNLEIIYILATPTYTPITGTLAEQLEAWYNAQSINGTTIITSNGNLPMIIKVRGLKGE